MSLRLSIIIPAYKVEDYIEKCIRSLEDQDIPKTEYEIIVTNDGSPDRCKEIVESLQKEFSNIVLVDQENQGVSMARNNAIAIAKGAYILPIDPDDYVAPNTFKHILAKAETNELDILYLGFEIFDADEKSIWKTNYTSQEKSFFNGIDGYFVSRGYDVKDPDRSCGLLFKRALLSQYRITYPKNVPYLEDGLFLSKVFSVAKKVGFDNEPFYLRTTRKGSATNSKLFFTDRSVDGFIYAIKNVKDFANESQLNQEQTQLINHTIAKFLILALSPSINSFQFKQYFKVISVLKKANLQSVEIDGLRFLYKKHIRMYNFSKLIFPFYFRITNKVN